MKPCDLLYSGRVNRSSRKPYITGWMTNSLFGLFGQNHPDFVILLDQMNWLTLVKSSYNLNLWPSEENVTNLKFRHDEALDKEDSTQTYLIMEKLIVLHKDIIAHFAQADESEELLIEALEELFVAWDAYVNYSFKQECLKSGFNLLAYARNRRLNKEYGTRLEDEVLHALLMTDGLLVEEAELGTLFMTTTGVDFTSNQAAKKDASEWFAENLADIIAISQSDWDSPTPYKNSYTGEIVLVISPIIENHVDILRKGSKTYADIRELLADWIRIDSTKDLINSIIENNDETSLPIIWNENLRLDSHRAFCKILREDYYASLLAKQ